MTCHQLSPQSKKKLIKIKQLRKLEVLIKICYIIVIRPCLWYLDLTWTSNSESYHLNLLRMLQHHYFEQKVVLCKHDWCVIIIAAEISTVLKIVLDYSFTTKLLLALWWQSIIASSQMTFKIHTSITKNPSFTAPN